MSYTLPKTVSIKGVDFPIREGGDYRVIIDVISALLDKSLNDRERAVASTFIFYDKELQELPDPQEAINQMLWFINCGDKNVGYQTNHKLIDWETDSTMIVSGINSVILKDVRELDFYHWWSFIASYMAIGESTLSTVINIRAKVVRGEKLEKHEQKFRQLNPNYFMDPKTDEDLEIENRLRAMWDNPGEGGK